MEKTMENNMVMVSGVVVSEKVFNHERFGESFYVIALLCNRLSGKGDEIPVMISDRMECFDGIEAGTSIKVEGQYRSYRKYERDRNRLMLSVFASNIEITDEPQDINSIEIHGYVCKQPTYRVTPQGRKICDLLLACNRPYGKSDYIPCITWGRNAKYSEHMEIGTQVKLKGRIQSREYLKTVGDKQELRMAYEVSASQIELEN